MSTTVFKFQGLDSQTNVLEEVKDVLSTANAKVIVTSAYLRKRAVEELAETLRGVGERGTVVVGIRNGATSAQALKALVSTGVAVYAVDTGATDVIFHSKLYAACTDQEATLICGSANFTPSGLWRNFESVTITHLCLANQEDLATWKAVQDSIDALLSLDQENVFRLTDAAEIDALLTSGRLVDESKVSPSRSVGKADIEDGKGIPRIKSSTKTPVASSSSEASVAKKVSKKKQNTETPVPSPGRYVEIWKSKELVRRDLNLPDNSGTNPTGSMLLKKGQYDINQQTYFRFTAFADYEWTTRADKPSHFQYAEINFRFLVGGIDYGVHKLEVKFDSRTDTATYKQKQPMASISWGDCKQFISDETLLGRVMTMYRDTESGTISTDGIPKNCTYVIEIK